MEQAKRREAFRREEVTKTAFHEAGHAVFMWRNGETLDGERFYDGLAPFDEIIVSPHEWDSEWSLPPLALANGLLLEANGLVAGHGRGFRLLVPQARNIAGAGISRARRREMVRRAKLEADVRIIDLLAGPVVEAHHDALREGCERSHCFYWMNDYDEADCLGEKNDDVRKAVAVAETELCRGWRQVCRYMDDAVARIEAKLDGDPRYWRTIEVLADALVERLRLGHNEAIKLMKSAWDAEPVL
jgi:hypothetical protein